MPLGSRCSSIRLLQARTAPARKTLGKKQASVQGHGGGLVHGPGEGSNWGLITTSTNQDCLQMTVDLALLPGVHSAHVHAAHALPLSHAL